MSSYNHPMAGSSGNIRKQTYDMFVSNFPPTANENILMESFVKFGPIAAVVIREGKKAGNKFAFVKFLCQESLDLALADTVYIGQNKLHSGPATQKEKGRGNGEGVSDVGSNGGFYTQLNDVAAASGRKPDIVSCSHSEGHPGFTHHNNQNCQTTQENKEVQLFMTHVDSPCLFWAQQPEMADVIANVERSLASVCPQACRIQTKPMPHKIYGTQFSFDEQWYRCELHRTISESQSEVVYIDYGNKEVVDNDRIVELPECLTQLNPLASKYCLYGLRAVDDPVLFAKGVEKLALLKETSVMNAILCEPCNGITQIKVKTSKGHDVNRVMLNSKFCVSVSDLDKHQISPKKQIPEVRSIPSPTPLFSKHTETNVRKIRDGGGDYDTGSANSLEKEVKQLLKEKMSLENLVKVVQREADSQKQALEAKLSLAAEDTFSKKRARVFAGLKKVMLIRGEFDSAASVNDPIEEALTVATGGSLQTSQDMVPVLSQIDAVRSRYQALQLQLRTASEDAQNHNSNAYEKMVIERNEVRGELFKLLQEFIGLFSDIESLTSHEIQIEKLLAILEVKYASYLALPVMSADVNLDSTSKAYLAWKDEKQKRFDDTRKTTDSLGSLVAKSVLELHEELVRRSTTVDLAEDSMPDFDVLFEEYGSAIDTEIELAKQGESANDIAIIQSVLISLTSELRHKFENLHQLNQLRARFLDECEELNQWLNKSPDISQLQATAKTIKALKSKLRYRLADLQDIQEDGRENSEEYRSVETDLEEIRGQLQQQLEIEDEQLKWLSVLTLNHFPEMTLLHPELNLQTFIKYDGLLKSGHMLDQFQLKPLPGCTKKYVYKSTSCAKPVILKEFYVGTQSDASKTQFLKSVKKYNDLMSPHLAQLVTVFFGMNGRQAVIVLPCYEFSLTQLMEDGAVGYVPDKPKVLGGVLNGINALHCMEVVHGAIHPNNILVNGSSGDVVVADYDFTKTPIQRSENPFITSSGLVFQAPELQQSLAGCQPSYLSDMYNFGLLILWIHSPQIASVPNNLPEISSELFDIDTARLVTFLLEKQPESRPATDQILAVGYFAPDELEEESFAANTKEEDFIASEADDAGTSVDVQNVETEVQLVEGTVKDVTEECEVETSVTEEDRRLPASVEEPETLSEEKSSITTYDANDDTFSAEFVECKTADVVSDDSCKDW